MTKCPLGQPPCPHRISGGCSSAHRCAHAAAGQERARTTLQRRWCGAACETKVAARCPALGEPRAHQAAQTSTQHNLCLPPPPPNTHTTSGPAGAHGGAAAHEPPLPAVERGGAAAHPCAAGSAGERLTRQQQPSVAGARARDSRGEGGLERVAGFSSSKVVLRVAPAPAPLRASEPHPHAPCVMLLHRLRLAWARRTFAGWRTRQSQHSWGLTPLRQQRVKRRCAPPQPVRSRC